MLLHGVFSSEYHSVCLTPSFLLQTAGSPEWRRALLIEEGVGKGNASLLMVVQQMLLTNIRLFALQSLMLALLAGACRRFR